MLPRALHFVSRVAVDKLNQWQRQDWAIEALRALHIGKVIDLCAVERELDWFWEVEYGIIVWNPKT